MFVSKKKFSLGILLIIDIFLLLFLIYKIFNFFQYFPLVETMKASGFKVDDFNTFSCMENNKEVKITFNFINNIITKNQYTFSLDDFFYFNNKYYIKKPILESVLNGQLSHNNGKIVFEEYVYKSHDWLNSSTLIAHAGGAVREPGYAAYYTNSLEALIQNYNLGHRIFEFDLYLTSDNNLAVVHDWDNWGTQNGTWLSAEEYKSSKTFGYTSTECKYTTMLISDLLDEMLVNKDMFLVTDTKSFDFTNEQIKLQFQIIYDEAMKKDPSLLDRIIPQIYNQEMYDIITSIYNFQSIIYTVYMTTESSDNIISFAAGKDNIKVITAPFNDLRFDKTAIKKLHSENKKIFLHTIDYYYQLDQGILKGIDGFYTNLIIPTDYKRIIKK